MLAGWLAGCRCCSPSAHCSQMPTPVSGWLRGWVEGEKVGGKEGREGRAQYTSVPSSSVETLGCSCSKGVMEVPTPNGCQAAPHDASPPHSGLQPCCPTRPVPRPGWIVRGHPLSCCFSSLSHQQRLSQTEPCQAITVALARLPASPASCLPCPFQTTRWCLQSRSNTSQTGRLTTRRRLSGPSGTPAHSWRGTLTHSLCAVAACPRAARLSRSVL